MLIPNKLNGYRADGRRLYFLDFGSDAPPPPDYAPVAQASKEVAEIGAQLGREQLTESKRQYENNMAVAQPVVDAQLKVMQQGVKQGDDYYTYSTKFRPLEQAMLADVTGMSAGDVDKVNYMRGQKQASSLSEWQKIQNARSADLQKQISAAQTQENQLASQQQGAQANGQKFYVDSQGNVKTADAYKGLTEADPSKSKGIFGGLFRQMAPSPGADYKYFEYDRETSGDDLLNPLTGFTNKKNGTWLKTTDSPGQQAQPGAGQSTTASRSSQLQAELDQLRQQKFDDAQVDYSGADAEAQRLMMSGMKAKSQAEQEGIDRITNESLANAGELRARTRGFERDTQRDIALATGGNRGIYENFRGDIDADIGTAVADTRTGQTTALNTALRQAMRYGLSAPTNAQALSNQNATALAAAANNTRTNSINNFRGLVTQGIGLKQNAFTTGQASTMDAMAKQEGAALQGRNMRIQNDSLNWAKQLDVTGMARGMPGASQGAYGVAVGAGNSATQNQMAPGQALVGAMGQANNTTMQGRQVAMQGLSGMLNSQTSAYNAGSGDNGAMGALGTIAGAGITVF